uniref:Uncharacterized protein n=1 Tax=Cannabis sativa TaxID=3483 RepID=A0A803NJD8_CANSA
MFGKKVDEVDVFDTLGRSMSMIGLLSIHLSIDWPDSRFGPLCILERQYVFCIREAKMKRARFPDAKLINPDLLHPRPDENFDTQAGYDRVGCHKGISIREHEWVQCLELVPYLKKSAHLLESLPMRTNYKKLGFYKLKRYSDAHCPTSYTKRCLDLREYWFFSTGFPVKRQQGPKSDFKRSQGGDSQLAKIIMEATKEEKLLEPYWTLCHLNPLIEVEEILEKYATTYPDEDAPGSSTLRRGNRPFHIFRTPNLHRMSRIDQGGFNTYFFNLDRLKYPMKDIIDMVDEIIRSPRNPKISPNTVRVDPFVIMSLPKRIWQLYWQRWHSLFLLMGNLIAAHYTENTEFPRSQAPSGEDKTPAITMETFKELVVSESGIAQVGHLGQQTLVEALLVVVVEGTTQDNPMNTNISDESLDGLMFPKKGVFVTPKPKTSPPPSERDTKNAKSCLIKQHSLGGDRSLIAKETLCKQMVPKVGREVAPFSAEILDDVVGNASELNSEKALHSSLEVAKSWVTAEMDRVKADCKAKVERADNEARALYYKMH